MPRNFTPTGNYAQCRAYREIARAAAHDKEIDAKSRKPLGPRPYREIDPTRQKQGKWNARYLPRAPLPRTGKDYPYSSERQRLRGARA